MIPLFFRLIPIGFLCFALLACGSSRHQLHRSADASLPDNIGIQGYSAVSYFETGRAEPGSADYSVEFDKRIYYFTSAEQAETFRQQPQQYMPKFGEYCPYSLALGRRVGIDPTNFSIVDGQLLLYHNSVELDTLDVQSQREIVDAAQTQFKLLAF